MPNQIKECVSTKIHYYSLYPSLANHTPRPPFSFFLTGPRYLIKHLLN